MVDGGGSTLRSSFAPDAGGILARGGFVPRPQSTTGCHHRWPLRNDPAAGPRQRRFRIFTAASLRGRSHVTVLTWKRRRKGGSATRGEFQSEVCALYPAVPLTSVGRGPSIRCGRSRQRSRRLNSPGVPVAASRSVSGYMPPRGSRRYGGASEPATSGGRVCPGRDSFVGNLPRSRNGYGV